MFSMIRLRKRNKPASADNPAGTSSSNQQVRVSVTDEGELLVDTQGSSDKNSGFSTAATEAIKIVHPGEIHSIASLADGEHIVSGGDDGKIRKWRVEDGKEVERAMDAGNPVVSLAVSQDGKWIVCGTKSGQVAVWNARNHEKVTEFEAHRNYVGAVDISADGKKIATGSDNYKFSVWSFPTGKRLLGPLKYDEWLVAVKFSPDGKFIATAAWSSTVRVYDSHDGHVHAKFAIQVHSVFNGSLAWASDNRLFVLSTDSDIHCLNVSTKKELAKWRIQTDGDPLCIALACDDTIIVASTNSSLSLWDTTTHQQIGAIIHHSHDAFSFTVSPTWTIATAGHYSITLRNIRDIIPFPYHNDILRRSMAEKDSPEDTVQSLRVQNAYQYRKITHLENSGQELRYALAASQHAVNELAESIRSLRTDQEVCSPPQITVLEKTTQDLHRKLAASQHALHVYDKMYECETTYAHGRIYDVALSLHEISNEMTEDLRHDKLIVDWLQEFTDRCISRLRAIGDKALRAKEHNVALSAYSAILSLASLPYIEKLAEQGNAAMGSKNHDAAIQCYSNSLLLSPTYTSDIIVKCCEVRVGLLEDELVNVTKVIERDPSNHKGFKRKHVVLHRMGRYKEALEAHRMMLSRIENSPESRIRDVRNRYIDATPLIRKVVKETIRDIPRVLIDTTTGHLCDKSMQAKAFEECSMFNELRSSMIIRDGLDCARIQREVEKFYEYVMFSHRWQPPEPSFQMVEDTPTYRLPPSPANDKLINFCRLVQSRRFRWAWSDTCCINQSDKGVQQESVVAMFQWYCRAALTIVHLLDVHSKSQRKGSLWRSIWNTRGWTYQEYVASKVVQFYTRDWKPYLGLDMFNHKESPLILSEMEQATNFATRALATLQPGLTRVREKLYLASKRETTRVEDIGYSLFGIFNVTLPVIYGEGNQAVGRLLEHILARSVSVTILAWTGISGSNHTYLPSDLTVYDQVIPPHVPRVVESAEMHNATKALQSSLPDPSLTTRLYEQLYYLPPLSLLSGRLRLPGLVFPLNHLKCVSERDSDSILSVYHTTSPILGDIRIETKDNLAGMGGLVLVHPWISPLIDEDFWRSDPLFDLTTRALQLVVRLRQPFGGLLLASQSRVQYQRVATDSFIKVQVRAETPLEELMNSIRTVDVQ